MLKTRLCLEDCRYCVQNMQKNVSSGSLELDYEIGNDILNAGSD